MNTYMQDMLLSENQVTKLQILIDEIEQSVSKQAFEATGILSGKAGITIFYAYLFLATQIAVYQEKMEQFLDSLIDDLNHKPLEGRFSSGITGVGWTIQHLRNIQVIGEEYDEVLNELDILIDQACIQFISYKDFDLLHGYMGSGLYYLERMPRKDSNRELETIIEELLKSGSTGSFSSDWSVIKYWGANKGKSTYNMGLAHGIPSILNFASKTFLIGIQKEKSAQIIELAMNLCETLQNYNTGNSYFPYEVLGENFNMFFTGRMSTASRLGWCHGDMGVACSIYRAGTALGNEQWRKFAIEIMEKAASKRLHNAGLEDVGFCHGLASTLHIFYRFYQATGLAVFREAMSYWVDHIPSFQKSDLKESCGFLFRKSNTNDASRIILGPKWSLLEGVVGLALALMPHAYNIESTWDRIYLTDI